MITGDGAYIKKLNRNYILQTIIKSETVSRAELSKITGLNKATVSIQVADLLEEELIRESRQEHHTVGRRPIMLSVNRRAGFVLGVDLDYKSITFHLSDLLGYPVQYKSIPLETEDYSEIVVILQNHIAHFDQASKDSRYGLIHVLIGVHGTVGNDGEIFFVPSHKWQKKDLKADLEKALQVSVSIENNANLSVYAEKVFSHQKSGNLISIILSSGIGGGVLINGELQRGFQGYAGELGHMIISPEGSRCRCGNHGCWELYCSEPSLFSRLAGLGLLVSNDLDSLAELIRRKDYQTMQEMDRFINYLAVGLNNMINLYNPETIVLNSDVLHIYPDALDRVKSRLVSSVSQFGDIALSTLGKDACVMGAAAMSIQRFLGIGEMSIQLHDAHFPSRSSEANV